MNSDEKVEPPAPTYWPSEMDARRYRWCLEWLAPVLKAGDRVLEVGGCGAWTELLRAQHQVTVVPTDGDLRTCSYGADGSFDVVVCMEVLEHMHDQDELLPGEKFPNKWMDNSAVHLIRECARVLRPGGNLLLTTPNACSINVLWKVLNWSAGMMYRPHAREYTPLELRTMVKSAGLEEVRYETVEPWSVWHETEDVTRAMYRRLEQMLAVNGFSTMDRGEDQMILAVKPHQ
jgi:2-polyprenyl-3-methyl-5-hydroxy-6-metoxy-1,4-benzoquinol methylase